MTPNLINRIALLLATLLTFGWQAHAQISVKTNGSGTLQFNSLPTSAQGWTTLGIGSSAFTYGDVASLENAVQTIYASNVNQPLLSSGSINPPAAAASARWNSALLRLQTRSSGNEFAALLATLRNDTSNLVGSVGITYAYNVELAAVPQEEIPGHRAFYSMSGLPNTWVPIPEFSGLTVSTTAVASLNVNWKAGSNLFLLWVDDNAASTDGAYTIDNFAVSAAVFTNILITAQPQDTKVPVGYPAAFSVMADGATPLRYQWRKDAMPIGGATNRTLTLSPVVAADAGSYSVEVSNALARVVSSNALLELGTNPVAIITEPSPLEVNLGDLATLDVTVSGTLPHFQWFRNGAAIAGATNSSYSFTPASAGEAGFYYVTVSNLANAVRSRDVTVHLRQPEAQLVGMTNQWKYFTNGTLPGSSWQGEGFDDSGWPSGYGLFGVETLASVAPLIRTPLPLTNGGGTSIITYYFRTEFVCTNELMSTLLTLSNLIDDGAVFYLNGNEIYRQLLPSGPIGPATLASVSTEGVFTTVPLPGNSLRIGTNVFAVEVHQSSANSSDVVMGTALHLHLPDLGPPKITLTPTDRTIFEGTTTPFIARVEGTLPLSLQWLHDGVPVTGATNLQLVISNATTEAEGDYQLRVSNSLSAALSSNANLIVLISNAPQRTLVSFTNSWKFHSLGIDLGTAWRSANYDDSTWPGGSGIFANLNQRYLEPIGTLLPVPTPLGRTNTIYFRTRFDAPGTNATAHLILSNLIDDGAVFYLNGNEIHRTGISTGTVIYTTPASTGLPEVYWSTIIPAIPVLPTGNVLAVEVHQNNSNSTDIVFGMCMKELAGSKEPVSLSLEPADVAVPLGYPVTFKAEAFGRPPLAYQWFKNGTPLAGATNKSLQSSGAIADDAGVYQLLVSNRFNAVLSREAVLTILEDTNPPVALVRGPYLQNGTTNSVVVRWRTDVFARSQVWYGTNPAALNETATVSTFQTDHSVPLTDLQPNTRYYYAISTTTSNLTSGQEFTFQTVPMSGKRTRIWAQGDQGTATPSARAVINAFTNLNQGTSPDVWLLLGDNAYGAGTEDEYQTALFDFMPEVLRSTLLWSTMGNHETYSMDENGDFPYQTIFSPPTQGEGGGVPSGSKYYYSFNYGNIHFVCLDSELSSRETNGPMATWLREDLSMNDKDWLIAFWHSPPYTRGSHNSDNMFDNGGNMTIMRENFLPILEGHGVDLVLNGHSHCYERSFLLDGHYGFSTSLDNWMLKDAGTGHDSGTGAYRKSGTGPAPNEGAVYIVAGSAGQATFGTLDHPAMCVSLLKMGSLILDIDGQRLDGMFLRDNGDIEDRFTIVKGAAPEPLRIAQFRMENGYIHGAWKARAGIQYIVEASTAVTGAPWTPVGGPVEATGATMKWAIAMSGNAQFYRVREVMP